MTQEEKAKAYDEAIERAKAMIKVAANQDEAICFTNTIFPELNESEDERIRKELITHCRNTRCVTEEGAEGIAKWIAWLEKQGKNLQFWRPTKEQYEALSYAFYYIPDNKRGNYYASVLKVLIEDLHRLEKQDEQKTADKVEPKFHEGNWVVSKYMHLVMQILSNDNGSYKTVETDGTERNDSYDFIERNFKPWTIQDAKDGDVLVDVYGNIGIFDKCYDFDWMSCCSLGNNGGFQYFTVEHENEKTYPATKEQRDLLFQKMKEAGYEWDAEKKELKKIDNRFDYEHANIQQKDFAPKATTANRQLYNRAILKILSDYVEKYPDIRFGQMLYSLGIGPVFNEESQEIYLKLDETINKQNHE